jgi:hypothetical protein
MATLWRMKKIQHSYNSEWIVFIDESGVNTNQKDGGNLGGELFIVPSDDPDTQLQGAATDMKNQSSVLP